MKVLAVDASTHSGWALLEGEIGDVKPALVAKGLIENDKPVTGFGNFPECYVWASTSMADKLMALVQELKPDMVVIEEVNLGKSRYAQKLLDGIHYWFLRQLQADYQDKVIYISSSIWRQTLDLRLDSEQRRNNAKLAKAKKLVKETGISIAAAKKKLGIKGKITKKHLAVNRVNEVYELGFKVKHNDTAEAICLGMAYFQHAEPCDGTF
jgi:hypothetical protein